jgi:hypothetical protein
MRRHRKILKAESRFCQFSFDWFFNSTLEKIPFRPIFRWIDRLFQVPWDAYDNFRRLSNGTNRRFITKDFGLPDSRTPGLPDSRTFRWETRKKTMALVFPSQRLWSGPEISAQEWFESNRFGSFKCSRSPTPVDSLERKDILNYNSVGWVPGRWKSGWRISPKLR